MLFTDRRTGEVSETLERLHGAGPAGLERMFGEHSDAGTPWPRAGRSKRVQDYEKDKVTQALISEPKLEDIDPRTLHSTQGSITRPGVKHYLDKPSVEASYSDPHNPGNKYPVVYSRHDEKTGNTEHLLLSGHHRAAAALLRGEFLKARHVSGGWGPER